MLNTLWKNNLNSDGEKFQQYQQNVHSPLTLNTKMTMTYDVGNPDPDLRQVQKCGGVKPVNGIQTLPSWYLDPQQQYI